MPPRRRLVPLLAAAATVAVLAACDTGDGRSIREPGPDQTESISVPAVPTTAFPELEPELPELPGSTDATAEVGAPWVDGGTISARFTCDGENVSPSLSWPQASEGTSAIGIAMVDDDAPDFVHWAMAGIDPARVSLAEGEVPIGALQSTNSGGTLGYTGPCPPTGEQHTYRIIVFYLDDTIDLAEGDPASDLIAAMTAGSFESSSVTGIYRRGGA